MGTGDGVADAANLAGSLAKDIYLDSGLSRHGSDYSGASGGGGHLRRGGRRRERVRLQETNPHSADETEPDPGVKVFKEWTFYDVIKDRYPFLRQAASNGFIWIIFTFILNDNCSSFYTLCKLIKHVGYARISKLWASIN